MTSGSGHRRAHEGCEETSKTGLIHQSCITFAIALVCFLFIFEGLHRNDPGIERNGRRGESALPSCVKRKTFISSL